MRLFFGIFFSAEVLGSVIEVRDRCKARVRDPDVKFTRDDQLHLTLHFLGQHADGERAIAAARKVELRAFDVTLAGLGAFPTPRRANVLWLGVHPCEPLMQLASRLGAALSEGGFVLDTREYHPHVTLARVKTPKGAKAVGKLFEKHHEGDVGTARIDRFALVESKTESTGSVYTPIEWFPLRAGSAEGLARTRRSD